MEIDLAQASVFVDFDGTISAVDSGVHLLERLGAPEWRDLSEAYARGEIGSRECVLDEWELLPRDESQLREVAREVEIDAGFAPLLAALRAAGAEVTVVSDGFGFYAEEVCGALGVPLIGNRVDWVTGELEFPFEDRCCPCSTCGTCKQAPIKDAQHAGRTTVLIGDGTSDRKAALLADVVFAKGPLRQWCELSAVPHQAFETLADVHAHLFDTVEHTAGA